jgi:nitrite reductase (NO-forming)
MTSTPDSATQKPPQKVWGTLAFSALRISLGILWAILAAETWSGSFLVHVQHYHEAVFQNPPGWLLPWFGTWVSLITPYPELFVGLARFFTTLIAIFLLIGFARKTTYIFGILFTLPLWTLMEGYENTNALGAINLGAAITYILVFLSLILIERLDGTTPYSVDYYIGHSWSGWRHVSESAGDDVLRRAVKPIPWLEQVPIMLIIAAILAFLINGSTDSIKLANQPSPSPLKVIGRSPTATARDARLPPLLGTGKDVYIHLTAQETKIEISSGVYYQAWTFDSAVPGPVIHVRQGQRVHFTLTNNTGMPHSMDFHAAEIAPNMAYENIDYGETIKFTFVPKVPGAFIYHCGTPPVLLHMGNGMYGVIIVDPIKPLPPADVSYVIEQSEWYTRLVSGVTYAGDYSKMLARTPDLVVFNGTAFQYKDHPLPAKAGKRIRIYFVNAGPNLWSAFHIIGGIFDKVYPDGDASHALTGVSTYSVPPGEGAVFDIIIPHPGAYAVVDHSMASMAVGAVGVLDVR